MTLVYTIISGYIKCKEDICEIPFALIFLDKGVYRIETFFKEHDYFDRHKNDFYFTLIGKTEKGYDIEVHGLEFTLYKSENQKVKFICSKYIKLSDNRPNRFIEPEKNKPSDHLIWFIEIEGLKTHFGDHTKLDKYRNSGKVKDFNNFEFDHTRCLLVINHPDFGENNFCLTFTKKPNNNNVVIDFTYHTGHGRLYYNNYLQIKNELINFLSFANGGQIYVRRELTGNYYQDKAKDAQIIYLYSKKELTDFHCDSFIPINEGHSYTKPIFTDLFLYCFDKYYHLNKDLDLNALVFSINNSIRTIGLEERYFILITALEKLCSKFSKKNNPGRQTLIDKNKFDTELKPKLLEVLKSFEKNIKAESVSSYNNLKSRIGGINKNNDDIKQRMYDFFNYAQIPINSAVVKLIEDERHSAVHEGIIGSSEKERIENYWKLDHILRDCILNIIGYKGYRKRKIAYFSKSEMIHKEASK